MGLFRERDCEFSESGKHFYKITTPFIFDLFGVITYKAMGFECAHCLVVAHWSIEKMREALTCEDTS